MLLHHLNCRKNTVSKCPKYARMKNGRIIRLSKCIVCYCKKSKFIKQKEARGLLSSREIKKLSILLLGPL